MSRGRHSNCLIQNQQAVDESDGQKIADRKSLGVQAGCSSEPATLEEEEVNVILQTRNEWKLNCWTCPFQQKIQTPRTQTVHVLPINSELVIVPRKITAKHRYHFKDLQKFHKRIPQTYWDAVEILQEFLKSENLHYLSVSNREWKNKSCANEWCLINSSGQANNCKSTDPKLTKYVRLKWNIKLTDILSGHCALNKHLNTMGLANTPIRIYFWENCSEFSRIFTNIYEIHEKSIRSSFFGRSLDQDCRSQKA